MLSATGQVMFQRSTRTGRRVFQFFPRSDCSSQPVLGMVLRPISVLSADDRSQLLADLQTTGWTEVGGRDAIQKTYSFNNFVDAFGWMTKVAIVAEKVNRVKLRRIVPTGPARPPS